MEKTIATIVQRRGGNRRGHIVLSNLFFPFGTPPRYLAPATSMGREHAIRLTVAGLLES